MRTHDIYCCMLKLYVEVVCENYVFTVLLCILCELFDCLHACHFYYYQGLMLADNNYSVLGGYTALQYHSIIQSGQEIGLCPITVLNNF